MKIMHIVFALFISMISDIHSMNQPTRQEIADGLAVLSNAVFAELLASSRVPNPDEMSAVGSLTAMFRRGRIQIDEVRF
ncbi:MAG: hypothetical protein LBF54_02835, partial [Holosporaceae bacterium]|nr:hypothetical protein [Holosporaceae bacterium]